MSQYGYNNKTTGPSSRRKAPNPDVNTQNHTSRTKDVSIFTNDEKSYGEPAIGEDNITNLVFPKTRESMKS